MIDLISVDLSSRRTLLEVSHQALVIINNSIKLVIKKITYAFQSRMGCSLEEVISIQNKISNVINENNINTIEIVLMLLSFEEAAIVNDCLNEVCNGLKIDDFEKEIGVSKEFARDLLNKLHLIIISNFEL